MRDFNELLELHKVHKPDKEEAEAILNGENLFPFNADIGMVFTCHVGHMPFMKYVLQQYRKIENMFVIGAYDPGTTMIFSKGARHGFPYSDIWSLAHMWVSKHYTWGGLLKRHGWLWLQIYSAAILKEFKNIKYIFSANGDCVWDKPEGVNQVLDVLGDNDFMSGQSETRESDGHNFIHSASMVFKRDAYFNFIEYINDKVRNSSTVSYSPEGLLNTWVKDNGIKFSHAPVQPIYKSGEFKGQHDIYSEQGCDSTWLDTLGYRNLEAEKNWRCTNRVEPLDKKYFDLRDCAFNKAVYYNDHDKNTLCQYYLTGDHRYVEMWWDQDPVSVPRDIRIERMKKTLEDY